MKRLLILVVVLIISAVFVACQPGAASLSDQDQAAIRKVLDDATKMANSPKPDYAAYVKLYYGEDATVLVANTTPVQGQAAIQTMLESFPPMSEFKADIVDLDGRGDLAYVRGNYSMTLKPAGAPPMTDRGKYVEIWKKQTDGAWRVRYDSWSSDLPVPGILMPTGPMAADASAELKKLGDLVGHWQMDGKFQVDPKVPAGPVALTLTCDWFAGGRQIVYGYSGTLAGSPMYEVGQIIYDTRTKTYTFYAIVGDGSSGPGKLVIEPGTWIHTQDTQLDGKPARARFTLANMSPAGGTWKYEVSVAGGPFAVMGDGKYAKAN